MQTLIKNMYSLTLNLPGQNIITIYRLGLMNTFYLIVKKLKAIFQVICRIFKLKFLTSIENLIII